jgi:hypothetical protein
VALTLHGLIIARVGGFLRLFGLSDSTKFLTSFVAGALQATYADDLRVTESVMRSVWSMVAVGVALIASACARRPDAIAPVAIPGDAYMAMSCSRLAGELINEQTKLAALSSAQNSAATGDAVGVFLIGVPASSVFGGDQEGNVAVSKGKVIAIENARLAKNC